MNKEYSQSPATSVAHNEYFDLEVKANQYRLDTLDMCINAGTGHVTSSMSSAEILAGLYDGGLLRHNPENPEWEDRDRFVLSKGQASPILYVALAHQGYFPREDLEKFALGVDGEGKDAPFGVHLQCDVPGVEFTTGSLGLGLGYGIGVAQAAKMDKKDHLTYVLLGDGELYEGSNWECAFYAPHKGLNNLIGIVDRNHMCTNGYTEQHVVKMEPLGQKFEAFGWDVHEINGHSIKELMETMEGVRERAQTETYGKPLMIIANTEKGKGIESLVGRMYFHGLAPTGDDIAITRRELQSFVADHSKNGGYSND